jgi:YbbR domain-containing protein
MIKKIRKYAEAFSDRLNSYSWFIGVREFVESKKLVQKLLCLLIAAVLWYYNDTKRLSELHFKVPVQVDMSRDYAVSDMERRQVSVIVRGNVEDLRNVGQNNLSAFLRIQNPVPGDAARYPVTVLGNDIPESVLIEPTDKTLYVTVERRMTKRVSVDPVLEGSVDSGYFVGNCVITPAETDISGAESIVRKIKSLRIEPISVTGYTAEFKASARLQQDAIRFLDVFQKSYTVDVPVFDGRGLQRIHRDILPVNIPDTIAVSIVGRGADIYLRPDKPDSVFSSTDFDLYIDWADTEQLQLEGPEEKHLVLPVRLKNRSTGTIVEVVPDKIAVKVRKK